MTFARRAATARLRATRLALPPFPPAECMGSGRDGFPRLATGAQRAARRAGIGRFSRLESRARRAWNIRATKGVFFAFRKMRKASDLRITSHKITHIKLQYDRHTIDARGGFSSVDCLATVNGSAVVSR